MALRKGRVPQMGVTSTDFRKSNLGFSPRRALHEPIYNYAENSMQKNHSASVGQSPNVSVNQSMMERSPMSRRAAPAPKLLNKSAYMAEFMAKSMPGSNPNAPRAKTVRRATPQDAELAKKFDVNDLSDIRRRITDKYGGRSDIRNIFSQWDASVLGVIRPEEIVTTVTKLGIPISLAESRALVAGFDSTKKGSLNLSDFTIFMYSDNEKINVDKNLYNRLEANKTNAGTIHKALLVNLEEPSHNIKTKHEINHLKSVLKNNVSDIATKIIGFDSKKSGKVSLQGFVQAVRSLDLPHSITQEKNIKLLYSEMGGDESGIYYKPFITHLEENDYTVKLPPPRSMRNPALEAEEREYGSMDLDSVSSRFRIVDIQKVPFNILDDVLHRARKVRKMLRDEFKTKTDFNQELEAIGSSGVIDAQELGKMVLEISHNYPKEQLNTKDINSYLSSYIYNVDTQIKASDVSDNVFKDDLAILNGPVRNVRPMPPNKQRLRSAEASNSRLKALLGEIEEQAYGARATQFGTFKNFDINNDGYIDLKDLDEGLNSYKIKHSEEDVHQLMNFLDLDKNGYVNFQEFSKKIRPNIMHHNADVLQLDKSHHISAMQPSHQVHKNIAKHDNIEATMDTFRRPFLPSSDMKITPATRYGARPAAHNTFENFVPVENSSLYSPDKERHVAKNYEPVNFHREDKAKIKTVQDARIQSNIFRNTAHELNKVQIDSANEAADRRNIATKAKKLEEYEKRMH